MRSPAHIIKNSMTSLMIMDNGSRLYFVNIRCLFLLNISFLNCLHQLQKGFSGNDTLIHVILYIFIPKQLLELVELSTSIDMDALCKGRDEIVI